MCVFSVILVSNKRTTQGHIILDVRDKRKCIEILVMAIHSLKTQTKRLELKSTSNSVALLSTAV